GTADRNRSHWSTSKTPSYTKSVSWQHHPKIQIIEYGQHQFTERFKAVLIRIIYPKPAITDTPA
ncbi:hypothetical protein, partial [Escherichia coli]